MQYTITEIKEGAVTVTFEDGSWANVPLHEQMNLAQVDAAVAAFAPRKNAVPSFLQVGFQNSASLPNTSPDTVIADTSMEWFQNRVDAYGSAEAQLEFITENGLEAWQAYVAQVKADNPKE